MKNFKLTQFKITKNLYLSQNIKAFYTYTKGNYRTDGDFDFINKLKNDEGNISLKDLEQAKETLLEVFVQIEQDFSELLKEENISTICIVPRARVISNYSNEQLYFLDRIKYIIECIKNAGNEWGDDYNWSSIEDGTEFILRHTDTKTTHRNNSGEEHLQKPYKGITKDTCYLSPLIKGKNILLIDDVYTKDCGIDEDCIQAILDNGASKVIFLAIRKTI